MKKNNFFSAVEKIFAKKKSKKLKKHKIEKKLENVNCIEGKTDTITPLFKKDPIPRTIKHLGDD